MFRGQIASVLTALKPISPLAPGDFKVAERQAEVLGEILTAEALIEALRREAARRNRNQDGVGFLAKVG